MMRDDCNTLNVPGLYTNEQAACQTDGNEYMTTAEAEHDERKWYRV